MSAGTAFLNRTPASNPRSTISTQTSLAQKLSVVADRGYFYRTLTASEARNACTRLAINQSVKSVAKNLTAKRNMQAVSTPANT